MALLGHKMPTKGLKSSPRVFLGVCEPEVILVDRQSLADKIGVELKESLFLKKLLWASLLPWLEARSRQCH